MIKNLPTFWGRIERNQPLLVNFWSQIMFPSVIHLNIPRSRLLRVGAWYLTSWRRGSMLRTRIDMPDQATWKFLAVARIRFNSISTRFVPVLLPASFQSQQPRCELAQGALLVPTSSVVDYWHSKSPSRWAVKPVEPRQ